jgi:hypothetical protein
MPITIVNAPVIVCRVCKHSLAVCVCNVTPESFKPGAFLEIDWTQQVRLDRERERRTLEELKQYQTERTTHLMSVKMIDVSERKPRLILIGRFATLPEVVEMWATLPKLPKGKALEVAIPDAAIESLKKDKVKDPVKSIVAGIRRKFANDGLAYDAYSNGDGKTFTVVHESVTTSPAAKK